MNNYSFSDILKVLAYRWKLILIITLSTTLLATAASFLIKPKYKSVVIVYPSNLLSYGIETPTEQMLQLLHSEDIRDRVIEKFNLNKHYKIDSTSRHYRSSLIETFRDNVDIQKTEFESVKIEVLDTDPEIASKISGSMIEFLNEKARELQRSKSLEIVEITRKSYLEKKNEVDSIESKLKELRINYGLLDYNLQTEYTTEAYLKLLSGNETQQKQAEKIRPLIKNLEEKGGEFYSLVENLKSERNRYNNLKIEYENSLNDITKFLTYSNIVTHPYPADKKSYPVRWIIVLAAFIAGLILSFLVILYEQRKEEIKNIFHSK